MQVDAPEPVHAIARVPAGSTAGWLLDYDRDFPGLATSRLPRLLTAQASPAVKRRTLADRSHPSPRRAAQRHGQHPSPRSLPCVPDEPVRYAVREWCAVCRRHDDGRGDLPDARPGRLRLPGRGLHREHGRPSPTLPDPQILPAPAGPEAAVRLPRTWQDQSQGARPQLTPMNGCPGKGEGNNHDRTGRPLHHAPSKTCNQCHERCNPDPCGYPFGSHPTGFALSRSSFSSMSCSCCSAVLTGIGLLSLNIAFS